MQILSNKSFIVYNFSPFDYDQIAEASNRCFPKHTYSHRLTLAFTNVNVMFTIKHMMIHFKDFCKFYNKRVHLKRENYYIFKTMEIDLIIFNNF